MIYLKYLNFNILGGVTILLTIGLNIFNINCKNQELIGVLQQDCYYCGINKNSTLNDYADTDSIGMINLNTWEITDIEINSLKKKNSSGRITTELQVNKDGSNITLVTLSERGLCDININLKKDSELDVEKMSKILCDNCINKILSLDSELGTLTETYKTPDYAIIDFKTNEIHSINKIHILYFIRDYCVNISYKENRIRVFIVYAPLQNNKNLIFTNINK